MTFPKIPLERIPTAIALHPTVQIVGDALTVLFVIAAVVAAIEVTRAGVLHGLARWVLLAVALCLALVTLPDLPGTVAVARLMSRLGPELIVPSSVLVLGAVYVSHGLAAVRFSHKQPRPKY
ncbi:MAG: hypothetical protein JWQ64_1624 [Subtercola sp.]|nr:hypothetical protein [Subtercola sp.]